MFGVSTFVGDSSSKTGYIGGNIGKNTCLGINSSFDLLLVVSSKFKSAVCIIVSGEIGATSNKT